MAKTKTRASNLPVPQSDEEAAAAIARYGRISRQLALIDAGKNNQIAAIAERAAAQRSPLEGELRAVEAGLEAYCSAHRSRLTGDGKTKTVRFATGSISWSLRPPSVSLPRAKEAISELVARLKAMRLDRFLRVREEVDKRAMLAEPAIAGGVQGVTIIAGVEDFVVEPLEMAEAAS